ncbi:helix-turn-helix domain-containing protein [Sporosarcina sp. NPDC096371]|uniref:helix-turn-helix domain-containing protein n=1 Tax=Sporosarcina sp. NPDC096371 TaxID=3364530 RepID=UPI003812891B
MQLNNLGIKIKEIRKKRQMTLKCLADQTAFSISFLSQLERGKSSATLESLKKISIALDVNPSYFFTDPDEEKQAVNRNISVSERMNDHNIYYKDLSGAMSQPAFSPLLVVLKPGQNDGDLITHDGQEFLYVLEGQLTVQIGETIHLLDAFDSIMFDSKTLHYWYNYTDRDVRFLCISYDEKPLSTL